MKQNLMRPSKTAKYVYQVGRSIGQDGGRTCAFRSQWRPNNVRTENVWKYINFLDYNNHELMVLSALDRYIFGTDFNISLTSPS